MRDEGEGRPAADDRRGRRFWTYPPIGWVAYLPVLAVYGALLAVVAGAGDGLGIPSLVWHDLLGTQIWAGFAVAVLCAELSLVGYLLDSRESSNRSLAPDRATAHSLARYLTWPLLLLWGAVAVGLHRHAGATARGAGVLVGPIVVSVVVAILRVLPSARRPILLAEEHPRLAQAALGLHALTSPRGAAPRAPAPDPGAHVVQFLVMVALAIGYVAAAFAHDHVAAAVAVCLALALAVGVWGLLRFWARRWRLFWFALFFLVACALGVTADVPATGLAGVTFTGPFAPPRELVRDCDALAAWKGRLPQARPPLVIVATSGGAARAAAWTINVLGALEARVHGFSRHVRLVTGASGGMVGAAHYISGLFQKGETPNALDDPWFDGLIDEATQDSLTVVTRALILPVGDRGTALEESWEAHTHERLTMKFRDLLPGEKQGWLPSVVYAPMLVEDGRRLFVSNLDLRYVAASLAPEAACAGECPQSISAIQLFACLGKSIDEIKLSTVARLNATFPWVTSASLLTSEPQRRIVDAGYYDNYGVDIATAWLRKNAAWLLRNTSGVLLVQIRDGRSHATEVGAAPAPGLVGRWTSALLTPVDAFLSARDASMVFRNDQKVEALAAVPGFDADHFFATETFEFQGDAPLEWYLDQQSIRSLKQPPDAKPLDAVAAWWDQRLRTTGPAADAACAD